jgi:hypothetical protein
MPLEPAWRTFEHEIGLLVEAFGYTVEVTPGTNDFGADVIAVKRGRRVAIQCKLYSSARIGHPVIINLSGAKAYYGAEEAICIATSVFTKQARVTAEKLSIHLVDKDKMIQLCREVTFTLPSLTYLKAGVQVFSLRKEGGVIVGRDESCGIRLHSNHISREHCMLVRKGGTLLVRDLNSTNGTLVNSQKLAGSAVLNYGDIITIGDQNISIILKNAEE